MATNPTDPVEGCDLREYRFAVATFVRLMIRARAKAQPKFLTPAEYKRWGLENITADEASVEMLLLQAATVLERLWREFIGPNGSGGVRLDDPHAGLKELVIHLMFETRPTDLL